MSAQNNHGLIHQIESQTPGFPLPAFLIGILVVALTGTVLGFAIAKVKGSTGGASSSSSMNIKTNKAEGISDKKTFKDQAEGMLKEGGIDGEGNYHLERTGGTSQNVYLTSTTVDLSQYVGKKVRVHGETFNAQKAGWLMDVGLVEVL
jgi:hypothetical protein